MGHLPGSVSIPVLHTWTSLGIYLSSVSSLSEEDDGKSDSDGGDLDKQMGDLNGEEADKLDERLWGDDDEEEEEEEEDSKTEETGPGMDEVIKRFPLSYSPQVERRHCSHPLPFSVIYCSSLSLFFFFLSSLLFFFFFASS